MTELLEKAVAAASQLPAAEQDAVASVIPAELHAESCWRDVLSKDPEKLRRLAEQAREHMKAGRTKELDIHEV